VKSRATGQAETSWREEVEREESNTKKPKIEEKTQGADITGGSVDANREHFNFCNDSNAQHKRSVAAFKTTPIQFLLI
jgi:hypothetical protein